MKNALSKNFNTSSIAIIGALHQSTIFHSSQHSGTIPKTLCKIGV